MSSPKVHKDNNTECYFLTFTVMHWYYLFDRHNRWQILADSLTYAVKNKELKLYGFVFMLNHIHLLVYSPDVGGFIRDFKKFTSKRIKENIIANEPRVLSLFEDKEKGFQLWQPTNMPVLIEPEAIFRQKLEYILNNPVKKQYVALPEHWYWSSANTTNGIPIELE